MRQHAAQTRISLWLLKFVVAESAGRAHTFALVANMLQLQTLLSKVYVQRIMIASSCIYQMGGTPASLVGMLPGVHALA